MIRYSFQNDQYNETLYTLQKCGDQYLVYRPILLPQISSFLLMVFSKFN